MKLKATILLGLLSTTAFTAEFNKPTFRPDSGHISASSQIELYSSQFETENNSTDNKTDSKTDAKKFYQEVEFGVSKDLSILADLHYTISQDDEGNSDTKSSGLEKISAGASYRVSNLVKLPFTLDGFGKFAPSFANNENATSTDDGTVNSGGHEIILGTKLAFTSNFYFNFTLSYLMEQIVDNASTGNESHTIDAFTTMDFTLGAQFSPMNSLALNVEGLLVRNGEKEYSFNAGGSQTNEAHYTFGFNIQSYYDVMSNVSVNAGLKYLMGTEFEIDAYQDQTVSQISSTSLNLGATYHF
jgi:hypothetical protein